MELSEAFYTIDATLGMFKNFTNEINHGYLKEDFLLTHVCKSNETVVDENWNLELQSREYYTYVDCDTEYKMYIVNIHPVCEYIINEWPSPKAKKIQKNLKEVFHECLDIYNNIYKDDGIAFNISSDEGYYYKRYNICPNESRTIDEIMYDTIYDMNFTLSLTNSSEPEEEYAERGVKTHTEKIPVKSDIPQCLTTPEAEIIWESLREGGFVVKDGYGLTERVSANQATYIADLIASKLGIKQSKWKMFQQLWNIKNMAQMAHSWQDTGKLPSRAKEINNLMQHIKY